VNIQSIISTAAGRVGTDCEARQYLYDPNAPSALASSAGSLLSVFNGADADGYTYNPLTGEMIGNPVENIQNWVVGLATLFVPGTKGIGGVANTQRVLTSSNELAGVERASQSLLDAIGRKREITWATPGSGAERYLNMRAAEAAAFPPDPAILLRSNPSKAAALEEFLHGTQSRIGVIERLGKSGFGSAETHVKNFMIRHQNMLGLGTEDVQRIQKLRDMGL